jgi:hypothetical protein
MNLHAPAKACTDPMLAVRADTWHFKYFKFIRGLWGCDVPHRTSLCPYVQTMIWFSIAAIILSPLIVVGWMMMKFIRIAYKSFSHLGLNFAVDIMDKMGLGDCVETFSKKSEKAPLPATILFTILAILVVAAVLAVVGGVIYAVGFLIANIGSAPGAIMMILTKVGWFLFMLMAALGGAIGYVWTHVHGFFTNAELWNSICKWTIISVFMGTMCVGICYAIYLFFQTRAGHWLIDLIMLRVNGFGEARKLANERREAIKAKQEAEEEAKPYVPYVPTRGERLWEWVKTGLFNSKQKVGKGAGVALGVFGIGWEYIKGIHKNACPIIDFVNPDGSKPTPPPPPPQEDDSNEFDDEDEDEQYIGKY